MSDYIWHDRGTLCDKELSYVVKQSNMISPFIPEKKGNPSYGLSSIGYDMRLGGLFKRYKDIENAPPLRPGQVTEDDVDEYRLYEGEEFILEPGGFVLAHMMESYDMPSNIYGIVHDKSSYKRMGLDVGNTVLEPGWRGDVVLELTNENKHREIALVVGMGIVQVLFTATNVPDNTYGDGKYQDQVGVVLPR